MSTQTWLRENTPRDTRDTWDNVTHTNTQQDLIASPVCSHSEVGTPRASSPATLFSVGKRPLPLQLTSAVRSPGRSPDVMTPMDVSVACTLLTSLLTGLVGEQPLWLAGNIGDVAQSLLLLLPLLHRGLCRFLFKNCAKLRFHGELLELDFFFESTFKLRRGRPAFGTEFWNRLWAVSGYRNPKAIFRNSHTLLKELILNFNFPHRHQLCCKNIYCFQVQGNIFKGDIIKWG